MSKGAFLNSGLLKHIYFIILFVAVVFSCSTFENQKDNPKIIKVMNTSQINNMLCYDSIVESMEAIKLELTDNSFIYDAEKMMVDNNNNYFILDGTRNVLMFNSNGNYKRTFGAIGKGPGEYNEARDFCIFENRDVCILSRNQIYIYDINSGKFKAFINIQLVGDNSYYPEYLSQADSGSFFIWDSNPSVVTDYNERFDCLIRIDTNGKVLNSFNPRENYIIGIGNLSNSYDGGTWIRPAEGSASIIKAKADKYVKEYDIQFEDKLAPKDYLKNKGDSPYAYLDEYFNADFIKFINEIMDTKSHLHFSCIGKDYNIYSFFLNKVTNQIHTGIAREGNPALVGSDSMYFYSFFQDNEIDKPLQFDSIFKEKMDARMLNQSYIFKFKVK